MATQEHAELGLETGIGCIEHFAPGYDDHVDPRVRLVVTKQLANEPLGAVAFHGRSHLPGRGDAETGRCGFPVSREYRHEPARPFEASLIDELEIGSLSDVFGGTEGWHGSPQRQV
jgi:hypothetical protein